MFAFRVLTTVLIIMMMSIVLYFLAKTKVSDKASIVGFSAMEIVYIMAIIGIWS